MTSEVTQALSTLLESFVTNNQTLTGHPPCSDLENDLEGWATGPAVTSLDGKNSKLYWHPTPQNNNHILDGLEQGLEASIHPDLKAYFGSFWSDGIDCRSPAGEIHLLQIWNEADLDILRQNLLGHAFMKMKKHQPLTLFFGVGQGEEVLVIDNATGEVFAEIPGRRPHRRLAESLATFIRECTPV
ncbi:SecY-interacting protein Syd [Hahella ganghwensis]|uniref:SecY-interacting protein Syd n=1 Tax=Hahella ganghwensis TaxID=286420 RepID=UPI00038119E2|nr:SecY-interacting protein Syd [Hahella ganghwensis]